MEKDNKSDIDTINYTITIPEPVEYDKSHYYLGNPGNNRIISKDLYTKALTDFMNQKESKVQSF